MNETSAAFTLTLCILGIMAWIPLMIALGFMNMMRKIFDWLETR